MSRRRLVLFAAIVFLAVFLIAFSLSSNPRNDAQATQPLQIFLDENLRVPYNGLLWSNVYAGINNQTIWLKNSGPTPLENLSLIIPSLPANITLTWDCENYTLKSYELKKATLLLNVPSSSDVEKYNPLWMRFYVIYYKEVIRIE